MWQQNTLIVQPIILNNTYKRLAIYTTSSCNLNCKYCYEKNYRKGFQINHPQDYSIYINKLLELDPNNKNTLTSIELWGGEPLLGLEEFIFYLPDFIQNFPNLNEIQLSSNFTLSNSSQLIINLCEQLSILKKDFFTVKLQVSIDGPEVINDYNRGIGTTNSVIASLNNLVNPYKNIDLKIITNSIFDKKGLFYFTSYEKIEEWFNFFLDNFSINIKHGLFRAARTPNPILVADPYLFPDNSWTDLEGERYAQILTWADQWRTNNPEDAKRFIWPDYKINELNICAVAKPHNSIAISPNGEFSLCHRGVYENVPLAENIPEINLTKIFTNLMEYYPLYENKISLDDFKSSMLIYINLNWCPYMWSLSGRIGEYWFTNEIPLLYNGAMNILLKWSNEYANN